MPVCICSFPVTPVFQNFFPPIRANNKTPISSRQKVDFPTFLFLFPNLHVNLIAIPSTALFCFWLYFLLLALQLSQYWTALDLIGFPDSRCQLIVMGGESNGTKPTGSQKRKRSKLSHRPSFRFKRSPAFFLHTTQLPIHLFSFTNATSLFFQYALNSSLLLATLRAIKIKTKLKWSPGEVDGSNRKKGSDGDVVWGASSLFSHCSCSHI